MTVMYKTPKKGDIVICIDDDSDDEDFGASGLVFKGRKDLTKRKEYTIRHVFTNQERNLPTNEKKTWDKETFKKVYWGWHQVFLEGISDPVFLHNFKPKNT